MDATTIAVIVVIIFVVALLVALAFCPKLRARLGFTKTPAGEPDDTDDGDAIDDYATYIAGQDNPVAQSAPLKNPATAVGAGAGAGSAKLAPKPHPGPAPDETEHPANDADDGSSVQTAPTTSALQLAEKELADATDALTEASATAKAAHQAHVQAVADSDAHPGDAARQEKVVAASRARRKANIGKGRADKRVTTATEKLAIARTKKPAGKVRP
jgi:hypothetical protein